MTTINKLTAVDVLQSSDQLPLYDSSNGDARKASIAVVQTYMQDNLTFDQPVFTTQHEAAGAFGFDVTVPANINVFVVMTAAGSEAAVLRYPALADTVDKQEILIISTSAISSLTNTVLTGVTAVGYEGTLSANGFFKMRFDLQTATWYRVG